MSEVRPIVDVALPAVDRERVVDLSRTARFVAEIDPAPIAAALSVAVGATVELTPGVVRHGSSSEELTEPLVAVALTGEAEHRAIRCVVLLDRRTGAWLVERALGAEGPPRPIEPSAPLTEMEQGVVAYVVARVLSAIGAKLSVAAVLTTADAAGVALGGGAVVALPITIGGDASGWARALIPAGRTHVLPTPPRPSLDAAADVEITLSLVAAHGALRASDLSALRIKDTVVLEHPLADFRADALAGSVQARPIGSLEACFRCMIEDQTLRVVAVDARASPTGEPTMTEPSDTAPPEEAMLARVAEAPVPLTVEVGRITMTVADLAALRPGEVLTTGRTLGDRVTLRAGDKRIATGELVDVAGELGLRILELHLEK